ncbi:MAG: NAD(P)/FAD-dependent oxidoreductase [Burkholderiales bacterium]|nr:NAD(P)/FAD-dependent oxidoreductase [Burkholderiales bacterium]
MTDPTATADAHTAVQHPSSAPELVDVLIVGAGLSGIGAAYHLQARCPGKRFLLLEGRQAMGGTWDLFRYPGVRSDSDMHTLGYHFRPWRDAKVIADGPAIRAYIEDTAHEYDLVRHIRFGHRAIRASWSSVDARWLVEAVGPDGAQRQFSCAFLYMCSGYYDYAEGYLPQWPGMADFQGTLVHPQHWPADLDYAGKRVVVIGSGATAVTLVPELARTAAHVTMLQRSPTYIFSLPSVDAVAGTLYRWLPARFAHSLIRWKNVLLMMYFYNLSRWRPEFMKRSLLRLVQRRLGPDFDVGKHFTPRYQPWDQRLCFVPDADLFRTLRAGRATVVTDEIETFTSRGLRLKSGEILEADIIVTATGLKVQLLGGMQVDIDGTPIDPATAMLYKGLMYRDIPNFASAFGYTNASWTLKCDLTAEYVCRLLNHMDARGYDFCAPHMSDTAITPEPAIGLTSGYVQRARDTLPKQGSRRPWRLYQNYALDLLTLKFGRVNDGTLKFGRVAKPKQQ